MTQSLDLPPFTLDAPAPAPEPRRTWTPMLFTQLVVILAVLVAGVTGAALRGPDGGTDSGKDVLAVVHAASTSAAAQPTLRATYDFRISGSGLDVRSTGSMVADSARKLAAGSFNEIETRSIDRVSYLRLPNGRADAQGHHWVSFRAFKADAVVGNQDPLAALKLVGDPQRVEEAGEQKVNGVQTSHYRVHLDPARLGDAVAKSGVNITIPPGIFDQVKDAVIELWIDDDNLPRRMTMTLKIQQVTSSFRFDFFDYGKPVDVTAPESADVTELGSPQELSTVLSDARTG